MSLDIYLSDGEKKLLKIFMQELSESLGNNGCNDLSDAMQKCLTKEEWKEVNKEYHKWNGDPETAYENEVLPDFCVLYYLQTRLGLVEFRLRPEPEENRDVHTDHCCEQHEQCKYSSDACSVVTGAKHASFPCNCEHM